jgi:hypothetical protein
LEESSNDERVIPESSDEEIIPDTPLKLTLTRLAESSSVSVPKQIGPICSQLVTPQPDATNLDITPRLAVNPGISLSMASTSKRQLFPPLNETRQTRATTSPVILTSTSPTPLREPVNLKNVEWRRGKMEFNKNEFNGTVGLGEKILNLDTPYQFFGYFFSDDLLEHILLETHKYILQLDPSSTFRVTIEELRRYLGCCILMSLISLPSIRDHWGPLGNDLIRDAISINMFEKIKKYNHFNDLNNFVPRGNPGHDRLFRIRPLVDHLNQMFLSIPFEENLSIDEQLCSTKNRHYLKQ